MDHSIVSRETIRAMARSAFERGQGRESHNMNSGAAALVDWLDEYDRCTRAALAQLLAEEAAS